MAPGLQVCSKIVMPMANPPSVRKASTKDIDNVWRQMSANLNERLTAHADEVARKEAEYRRSLKLSSGSLLVTATLGVASVALPAVIPFAIGSALYSAIVGSKSVLDIVGQRSEHKRFAEDRAHRPVTFLLDLRQRSKARDHTVPPGP